MQFVKYQKMFCQKIDTRRTTATIPVGWFTQCNVRPSPQISDPIFFLRPFFPFS
jgi:hypothetical protein